MEIKYLLEFENEIIDADPGRGELSQLRSRLLNRNRGLFFDEDNAVIPFRPTANSQFDCYHVVGGAEAITGAQGDTFRILLVFERSLDPNHHGAKIKDVFMGENYTGEHPLKKARKFVVSCR